MKTRACCIVLLVTLLAHCFADEATSYDDIAFPQWAKDLRRTEIITFGSLPFVTIWVTLAYSEIKYGEFHNPLDKSADGFSTDDQKQIMQFAALSCVALGVTDLTITLVRRLVKNRKATRERPPEAIVITHNDESTKDGPPEERAEERPPKPPAEHLQGGIESAIF